MAADTRKRFKLNKNGSALIMTMVLTVLLAVVAVMFVAVARMDRASTSNIADNKMLESAAKSITEIISKNLVTDTPGVAGHNSNNYYDYPDANHPWLASLEPNSNSSKTVYTWRQISDVNNFLKIRGFDRQNVDVNPVGLSTTVYVRDYPIFSMDSGGNFLKVNSSGSTSPALNGVSADADGDGIADSKWIDLGMRSSKGQRIFAAVRVIDNSAMININTADKFDVNDTNTIDGSTQMQINLAGLLKTGDSIVKLHQVRCGSEPNNNWTNYGKNVIWDYNSVSGGKYLPFGVSDELELRYRYCIDSKFRSRIENNLSKTVQLSRMRDHGNLYDGGDDGWYISDWKMRITDPNFPNDPCANRRHLLTAYNLDRVIDPNGDKMLNVNYNNDHNILRNKIKQAILNANPLLLDANGQAAQIAANLIDFQDSDSNVTVVKNEKGTKSYYGFERPCVYISELAYRKATDPASHESYAIELYKPYPAEDIDPNKWTLHINAASYDVNWSSREQYHIIAWQNPSYPLQVAGGAGVVVQLKGNPGATAIFGAGSTISLTRKVGNDDIVVDSHIVPTSWPLPATVADGNYSDQRDITQDRCIRRLWEDPCDLTRNPPTLGSLNAFIGTDANTIVAHPANTNFNNVGEIGMVFTKAAYYKYGDPNTGVIGYNGLDKDSQVRLNLADPAYQQIFNYLTVWPRSGYIYGPNETRIKGRININTAPASVLAQLPWVAHRKGYSNMALANAIVAYRDKTAITGGPDYSTRSGNPGFRTIGQLCNVNLGGDKNYRIDYYKDANSSTGFPHLPSAVDYDNDKFANRDLIFARISDLITVRSDIFTAYMLIRIGTDGPQKRYMVILDRSRIKPPISDPNNRKVKVIAFQPVPEAR